MNDSETVREVCAEINTEYDRAFCDVRNYLDRILTAHEREMAANDAERFKYECESIELRDRIALLERALKPVSECNTMDAAFCLDNALWAVHEAQRIISEGEKLLPCPFCGGETIVRINWNSTHQVVCNSKGCWYCSKCETSKSDAIAAHNRVAKAVRESEGK